MRIWHESDGRTVNLPSEYISGAILPEDKIRPGEVIAQGGIGTISRGVIESANGDRKNVLLKQIRIPAYALGNVNTSILSDEDRARVSGYKRMYNQFHDEYLMMQALNSEGIRPKVIGYVETFLPSEDVKELTLVMEEIHGKTLEDILMSRGLSVDEVIKVTKKVLQSLQVAYEKFGFIHRDIKVSNIMVEQDENDTGAIEGDVVLIDWGATVNPDELQWYSYPERAFGTPAYAAPEQINDEQQSTKTDIYAVAIMMVEALMRRSRTSFLEDHGIDPDSLAAIFAYITSDRQAADIQRALYQLPEALPLLWIIMRAIDKDPANRQADPQTMLNEINRAYS